MADSPTSRSLKLLRGRGYRAAVVERWIPGANIRQDLFGCIDILAIKDGETLAIQCTSGSNNIPARIKKVEESPALPDMRGAGWKVHVHGWRKLKSGWACREVDLS